MSQYTPKNIFRNPVPLDWEMSDSLDLILTDKVQRKLNHGDGVIFAAYDLPSKTGLIRALGLVQFNEEGKLDIALRPLNAEIGVVTSFGHKYWQDPDGFRFADNKLVDYGLSQIFAEHYSGLELRPHPVRVQLKPSGSVRRNLLIPKERLVPMEIIGTPNGGARGGYVYVLKSVYGYKVGRTVNIPNRMRSFGVLLPFVYTIELCAWFDDHIQAETTYHRMFAKKHINGEWFALTEADVAKIRSRNLQ